MNDITFLGKAWEHYLYWREHDLKTLDRINRLLIDIQRHGPLHGLGKPERLKGRKAYSRRIDDKNRLVYAIDELHNIAIIACRGHYED